MNAQETRTDAQIRKLVGGNKTTIAGRLGEFRTSLVAEGVAPEQADAMVLQLFLAFINGQLTNQDMSLGDFC